MKNFKDIPIPQLMQDHCEVDPRGLLVPFIVLKDDGGKHHFKVNDSKKTIQCFTFDLCTICGQHMGRNNRWLLGGIGSAFDENGYYFDHPVHKECGEYALKVCPYLAIRNYNGKFSMDKLQEELLDYQLINTTIDSDRLPLFVFIRPKDIEYYPRPDGILIKAISPYYEIEFWDEGKQIKDLEIVRLKLINTKWEKYIKYI